MYKSAVMVSGRCLLKIHQNQNAFIDQWSKGRCLQDFCVHLGGQKVPPLPEPGCWCFFLVRCTEHNKTQCAPTPWIRHIDVLAFGYQLHYVPFD